MTGDTFGRLLGSRPFQYEPELEIELDRLGIGYRDFIDWRIERCCVLWGVARQFMYAALFAAERDAASAALSGLIERGRHRRP